MPNIGQPSFVSGNLFQSPETRYHAIRKKQRQDVLNRLRGQNLEPETEEALQQEGILDEPSVAEQNEQTESVISKSLAQGQEAVRQRRLQNERSQIMNMLSPQRRFSPMGGQDQGQAQGGGGGGPPLSGGEAAAKSWLIGKESSGKTTAKNPKSSAFGLGQLLIDNRIAYAKKLGISNPNTTDYREQERMMDAYVRDRYGTYQNAMVFHRRKGWY